MIEGIEEGEDLHRTGKDESFPNDDSLQACINAIERLKKQDPTGYYSKVRQDRERATFTLMLKMDPDTLQAIRKEWFVREDEVQLDEFIYIVDKHLLKSTESNSLTYKEKREFGSNMYELFKEVDVNGDGAMEWEELAKFIVEKANQLNKSVKLTSLASYYDTTNFLDVTAVTRHRHEYSQLCPIPAVHSFAALEDHKSGIHIFNARNGKLTTTINVPATPLAVENMPEKNLFACTCADATIVTCSTDDPVPAKRFQVVGSFSTITAQMSLGWMPTNGIMYSGAVNGNIYAWNMWEKKMMSTLSAHSDIVMKLLPLPAINNLVSASLDTTISVWDTYTHSELFKLRGHNKGVFSLAYNPDYRLLVSSGFDHEALLWSPFVKSLVYRLRGHHASLIGCQCVEETAEIITADVEGTFKLWDIRNFQCVQTWSVNDVNGKLGKAGNPRMNTFTHMCLPSNNLKQKEEDARIFVASKKIHSFDQVRDVHDAVSDSTGIIFIDYNSESSMILTVSEKNLIIWDALSGSASLRHTNLCGGTEITACCLDDRKRKLVVGDILGKVYVFNPLNAVLMKETPGDVGHSVVSLAYVFETRRFIAGYGNGLMRVYDEGGLDDCPLLKTFDEFKRHPELLMCHFSEQDHTVVSAGPSSEWVRMWDSSSGKCDMEIDGCDASEHILKIGFIEPSFESKTRDPILVTSDSRANVVFWGSRSCRWQCMRLAGFLNHNAYNVVLEPRTRTQSPEEVEPPRRALPQFEAPPNRPDRHLDELDKIALGSKSNAVESDTYQNVINQLAAIDVKDSELMWGRSAAAICFAFDAGNQFFFTGDDLGQLRKFSLVNFIKALDDVDSLMSDDKYEETMTTFVAFDRVSSEMHDRDHCSALLPVYNRPSPYLLTPLSKKMAPKLPYLGIDFCWAIEAHLERILCCISTSHGVLSSSSDQLVKMWSFDGRPIGELLASIPTGVRSKSWRLDVDVLAIMEKEDEELDRILAMVDDVACNPERPEIETADFSGLDPGPNAADFTLSELRQRVEMTSTKLGINFPVERSRAGDSVFSSQVDSLHSINSHGLDDVSTASHTHIKFIDEGKEKSQCKMSAISTTTNGSNAISSTENFRSEQLPLLAEIKKPVNSALLELKSADAIDDGSISEPMTLMQERRKAAKMLAIGSLMEAKSGIKLPTIEAKISNMGRAPIKEFNDDNSDAAEKLLMNGIKQRNDRTLSQGYSRTISNSPYLSPICRYPINSALKRLTTPTLLTTEKRNKMKEKCDKFSAFAALEAAMNRDFHIPIAETEKMTLKSKLSVKSRFLAAKTTYGYSTLENDPPVASNRQKTPGLPAGSSKKAEPEAYVESEGDLSGPAIDLES